MSAVPAAQTDEHTQLLAKADAVCRAWRACLRVLATTKPLSAAWLPRRSPLSGAEGTWWTWSPEDPSRLKDRQTGAPLPDAFPFSNHAARCAYEHVVLPQGQYAALLPAGGLTGERAYARTALDILVAFSPIYPTYPLTSEYDANDRELVTRPTRQLGQRLKRVALFGWEETESVQHWLRLYPRLRTAVSVTAEEDAVVRTLIQAYLETDSLTPALYFLDKYHNSMTNYYEAFIRAARLWGQALQVRELVGGAVYSGGDLVQLAVNSPGGIRLFAANAFDRNGMYWELSGSYTGYVFNYFREVLSLLEGYSDPAGYTPGDAVRPYYQPLRAFDPAAEFPELWRAAAAQTRLSQVNLLWPPTNDTNYLNGPNPDWLEDWAKRLRSERLRSLAGQSRAALADAAQGRPHRFPAEDTTLMPAAGAITARGPRRRMDFHFDWHRMQDYHSHSDPLNLVIAADGYLVLNDLGYHLGTPLHFLLSKRTIAHNTVTVDEQDARRHGPGILHAFIGEGDVKLAEASVPDAYPQCDLYRRSVVLVGDRYVIDCFRVTGGSRHDYVLLSRADRHVHALNLKACPGSLANPGTPWEGYDRMDSSESTGVNPYALLHHPHIGPAADRFTVDWPQRDRPDLTTRIHHLTGAGAEVVLAKVPQKDRRADNRFLDDEILVLRRAGRPGLASGFLSVIECLGASTPPLAEVERLPVESDDPWAMVVRVRHEEGTDVAILALNAGRHRVKAAALEFTGRFALIRYDRAGTARHVTLYDGALTGPFGRAKAIRPQSARVVKVDVHAGEIELDTPLGADIALSGRFVNVRSASGQSERWRVADLSRRSALAKEEARAGGQVLRLDLDHSALIVVQGPIERVENARLLVSRMPLPVDPPPGSTIRIGPVGDFAAPGYRLEWVGRSGFPLRLGGTVLDGTPREMYLGLDIRAKLDPAAAGQPWWISGIELGDEVFTEPATVKTWDCAGGQEGHT